MRIFSRNLVYKGVLGNFQLVKDFKEKFMTLTINVGNTMLCLNGTVITVYRNGKFVKRVEYESRWEARKVFLAVSK